MERFSSPQNEPINEGRRGLIRGALAFSLVPSMLGESLLEKDNPSVGVEEEVGLEPESAIEKVEPKLASENFDRWKVGYQAWWVMPYNSVVFVDEKNEPVAEPVAFQNFTVKRERIKNRETVLEDYLLTPGKVDEDGFLTGNLAGEWLRYVKEDLAEKIETDPAELKLVHVTEEFEKARQDKNESELINGINSGQISRLVDIVNYYGGKAVKGAESYTRIEYIKDHLVFTESGISPAMASELKDLVPALCAKESMFKDGLVSSAGARGIAQIKPDVWSKLGMGEYGESQPFTKQVEAIGLQFGQIYRELYSFQESKRMLNEVRSLFVDQESFEKDFLVPLMINSYNAGAKRMEKVMIAFFNNYPLEQVRDLFAPIQGKDLFFAMIQFAHKTGVEKFGNDASQYVGYIYALRDVFEASQTEEELVVASNN